MMRISRPEWFFITALLLFAAGLRLTGISFGQPDPDIHSRYIHSQLLHTQAAVHPDEYFYVAIPLQMVVNRTLNPHFFQNPSLFIYLNAATFWLTGAAGDITPESRQGVDLRNYAPFNLYVIGRAYSALGGLLVVSAAYALARRIAGRFAAAGAGMVTATSFTLVQHAHYATTSSVGAGLAMIAVWASVSCLYDRRFRWWLFALAGITAGFAAGTRYNLAAIWIVLFLAGLILLYRERSGRMARGVFLGWILAPAAFVLSTPYVLLDAEFVLKEFRLVSRLYQFGRRVPYPVSPDAGLALEYRYLFLFGLGVPAVLAALVGLYSAWKTRPRWCEFLDRNSSLLYVMILLAYLAPYSYVVLRTGRPEGAEQMLIPVIPLVAILAGVGSAHLYGRLPLGRPLLAPGLIGALVIVPLILSVQTLRQFTQPDTRQQLEVWIHEHLPADSRIHLNGPYNVAIDESLYRVTQNFGGDLKPLADLQAEGVDYVVLSDAWYFSEQRAWEIAPRAYLAQLDAYLTTFRALPRLAWIDRPVWTGYDWVMNSMSYWHNPGLTLYCLNEVSCAAVR